MTFRIMIEEVIDTFRYIFHQIYYNNKSSFEIVKLRQVPSTLSQLKKWCFSHVFSDEAILTPNVEEDSTVKNV